MKQGSGRSNDRTRRAVFFTLKAFNTAFVASQTFVTIFVLIRVLPHNVYSSSLLIISIAMYVMATDLGYSGYVYASLRREFIEIRQIVDWETHSEAFTLYVAISLAAALLVGGSIIAFADMALEYRLGLATYFASAVAALPWMLLRRIAAAVDLYVEFETLEFWRRLSFLSLSLAMLAGLSLLGFALLCMLAWLLGFWLAIRQLNRNVAKLRIVLLSSALAHAVNAFPNIARTGAFTLLEFAMLNFPYILVATEFRADSLIAFDVFFKLTRLGQFAYSVPAETLLPSQTAAFHVNDRRAVLLNFIQMLALGFLVLIPLGLIILVFGDAIFTLLLRRADLIGIPLRIAIMIMLAALLVQMSAGMLLTGTGSYSLLIRATMVTFSLMVGLAILTGWSQMSFNEFITGYVLVYSVHALLFVGCFIRVLPRRKPSHF